MDEAAKKLIVALDVDGRDAAMSIVKNLKGQVDFYKIGWQLFMGEGWGLIRELVREGNRIFLDLKIGDIEETVRAALANIPNDLDGSLELVTIHGNGPTVAAAIKGRNGNKKPRLLMVTALSSWDETDIKDFLNTSNPDVTLTNYIYYKAKAALDAGCEGLIASGRSVKDLRGRFGDRNFLIVTPGIRPSDFPRDDHKRTLTPYDAIVYGSDYLVVGRPITQSKNPNAVAKAIIEDISRALRDLDVNMAPTDTHECHEEDFNPLLSAQQQYPLRPAKVNRLWAATAR